MAISQSTTGNLIRLKNGLTTFFDKVYIFYLYYIKLYFFITAHRMELSYLTQKFHQHKKIIKLKEIVIVTKTDTFYEKTHIY